MNTTDPPLRAPFPWFGGKSRVSDLAWERLGDVDSYVEPFFGSGAVLLGRPSNHRGSTETVNDLDGFVANFWRALKYAPADVEEHTDNPVSENDLHARHLWLANHRDELADRLNADPEHYDAKVAGWWVWGLCAWIGSGWCSGNGPWVNVDGKLVRGDKGRGINRQLPHLGDKGRGINRRGDWDAHALAARLRDVRVCSGDWQRIMGDWSSVIGGMVGVFLDPPYLTTDGDGVYREESNVAHDVCEWAVANGDRPNMRIALCGYDGEHVMPDSWACVPWKAKGGYGSQSKRGNNENSTRERIWFSPHCLSGRQRSLF